MKAQSLPTLYRLLCLSLLSSLISVAFAEPIILSSDNPQPIELGSHYQVLVDNRDAFTIEDILSPNNQTVFSELKGGSPNLGFRKETHWFKVDVSNKEQYALKQLLEFNFPLLDDIGIYIVNKASKRIISRYDTGDTKPFHQRFYSNVNFIFPITLPAHTDLSFYFRIKSKGSMSAGANLWQADIFAEKNRVKYIFFALYAGLLLGLISYNFLLFFTFKQTAYLYYALFSSSILLSIGAYNGIWFEFIWPTKIQWQQLSLPIGLALSGLFAALFSKSLLQTATNLPILNRYFNLLSLIFVVLLASIPFISILYTLPILYITILLLTLTAMISSIKMTFEGERAALTYFIGWLPIIIVTILFLAEYLSWRASSQWLPYIVILGGMAQAVVLSVALAQRLNVLSTIQQNIQQHQSLSDNQLFYTLKESERELLNRLQDNSNSLDEAKQKIIAQERSLQKQVSHDPLTGLATQVLVKEQVSILLTRCKRDKAQLAVLVLRLDNYNDIIDKYSAQAADKLVVSVTKKLQGKLRNGDILGRISENEFVLIVESENGQLENEIVANRIKKSFSHRIMIDGYSLQTDLNIGMAIYPNDGEHLDTLVAISNKSMTT